MKPERLQIIRGPGCEITVFPAWAQSGHASRIAAQLVSLPEDRRARRWIAEQNRIRGQLVAAGITDRKTINAHLAGFHEILVAAMDGAAPGPRGPAHAHDAKSRPTKKKNLALAKLYARASELLRPCPEGKPDQLEFVFEAPTDGARHDG